MIYHIFNNGTYFDNFYRFTKENQASLKVDHIFVLLNEKAMYKGNVRSCSSFWELFVFFMLLKKHDRVIIHSYTSLHLWFLCFIFQYKLSKFSWYIWGADLYFYRVVSQSFKYRMYEFLRKRTIRKFSNLITSVKDDFEIARKIYDVKGEYLFAQYPLEGLSENIECIKNHSVKIILGNSADVSNEHKKMIDLISIYSNENISVYMPLSYGGNVNYIQSIIDYGRDKLGDKFYPIKEMYSYSRYVKFLKEMDVMICCHKRQQALGNLWIALSNGCKVFLDPEVTTNGLFKKLGLDFYTIDLIDSNFFKFTRMTDESKRKNNAIVANYFDYEKILKDWLCVYDNLNVNL